MKKSFRITVMALVAAGWVSCSVKEDRGPCPCWLSVDLGGCAGGTVTLRLWDGGPAAAEEITPGPGTVCERTVRKGLTDVSVTAGARRSVPEGPLLLIPLGEDADSLEAHARTVPCYGETARDSAVLHKQFARVFLKVENPVGSSYPYTFTVEGGVRGWDLRDLSPVPGPFRRELVRGPDDIAVFCLPRQHGGDPLTITVTRDGELQDTLPLSEWIAKTGYRWDAADLEDIYLGVDYARAEVTVSVRDWDDGGSIRIEI